MKKLWSVLLVLVLLAGLLAGCGSKGESLSNGIAEVDKGAAGDAIYGEGYETPAEGESETLTDQKLIKTVTMEAEAEDLDALLRNLDDKLEALGGYVEARRVNNGSAYSTRSRYASMTIRIPAGVLDEFVEQVEGMSNIISSNQAIQDVTLTYVATQSRLKTLQAEEERLLEFMGKAETMAEVLEVESRLTEVRYELESITSQMRALENQVEYATVNLSVSEVREYTVVEEKTPLQRMGEGFMESLKDLGDGIVELAVFVVAKLPYLLIAAVVIVVVVILIKRSRKNRRKRSQPPFRTEESPREEPDQQP